MKTNYAAVFISALAYWMLGAVWYGLLFSKPWMALEHITEEQARSMNPVLPYLITFVLNLLIAFVLSQICSWRNAATAARGARLIDAAVTRTRFGAAPGPFVLTMTGGHPALTERARAVLNTFSTQVVHAGPLGAGMALKITNNFVTWVHVLAIQQAFSLAKAGGVEIEKLLEVMTGNGNLTPVSRAVIEGLVRDGAAMSPERVAFAASQGKIGEKDLELALEFARVGKVELTMASHVRDGILRSMLGG